MVSDAGKSEVRNFDRAGEKSEEERIRRRIAEALRNDGASSWKIGQEILLLLPTDFLRLYEELFHKALDTADGGSRLMGTGRQKVDSPGNQAGVMGVAAGGRKYRTYGSVRDEEALALKALVDKRLRRIARDMGAFLSGKEGSGPGSMGNRKACIDCGKYAEDDWNVCPWCGNQVMWRTNDGGS